jgi:putative transposase
MDSVHLDNAREFRGNTLKYACEQYGIDIHWRPVAQPHFGGHVERLLGTLAKEIHTLPGTTFSRVKDLHEYKHGEMACMTLKEFDVWLANLIVCDYHLRMHTGLKMSPLAKYEEGIFGKGDRPGRGYPPVFTDTRRVELDFLPMFRRSIQVKGVVIDHIHYYHDALRRFIGQKQQFIFKRSPKDISIIHFYDPEQKQYHQIPQRDISRPPMTLWALREIVRGLVREGKKHIDEQVIYANRERRLELVQRASRDTEAARRKLRRLSVNPVRATKPSKALNAKSTPDPVKPDEIVEPYPVRED